MLLFCSCRVLCIPEELLLQLGYIFILFDLTVLIADQSTSNADK